MFGRSLFVCYRREDSAPYARLLFDRLSPEFERRRVFFDLDDIDYGDDFEKILEDALDQVSVVLVVIGPKWHDIRDAEGQRRLDLPDDYVRLEIQRTLERSIHLIPVLVGGAKMPPMGELPAEIQRLSKRQAATLGDATFDSDVEKLIASIKRRVPDSPATSPQTPPAETAVPALLPIVALDSVVQAVRRLQRNWMVALPLLAALCVLAQALYLGIQTDWFSEVFLPQPLLLLLFFVGACATEIMANVALFYGRKQALAQGTRGAVPSWSRCVGPMLAATAVLSVGLLGVLPRFAGSPVPIAEIALYSIGAPVIAWLIVTFGPGRTAATAQAGATDRSGGTSKWFEFATFSTACLASAAMLVPVLSIWAQALYYRPGLYLVLMFPTLLVVRWVALSLFTGILFHGGADRDIAAAGDAHREWWNCMLRRLIAVAIGWAVIMGLCVYAQLLIDMVTDTGKVVVVGVAVITGTVIALQSRSGDKRPPAAEWMLPARRLATALNIVLFVISLFWAVYWGTATISGTVVVSADVSSEMIFVDPLLRQMSLRHIGFAGLWIVSAVLVAISLAMGALIKLNRRRVPSEPGMARTGEFGPPPR